MLHLPAGGTRFTFRTTIIRLHVIAKNGTMLICKSSDEVISPVQTSLRGKYDRSNLTMKKRFASNESASSQDHSTQLMILPRSPPMTLRNFIHQRSNAINRNFYLITAFECEIIFRNNACSRHNQTAIWKRTFTKNK